MRLLVLSELINQNEVFRSILVLILLHTVKQIMRCVEFYVSKNFLPSFTLFRANCKDIDEILAFRIYKPPYYAYRYQPLEGAELESREFVFTKYRAPKFQFPKYFILEDFDLEVNTRTSNTTK